MHRGETRLPGDLCASGKRFFGISHIADHRRGTRFDFTVIPAIYRRQLAVPDALRPAGAPAQAVAATFVYHNVACNVRAAPGPRAGETTLVYRFTDDEVYVRPPRKEKP